MTGSAQKSDPFVLIDSEIVYENPWIRVEHQSVIRPDGKDGVYGIVHFANRAVAIMPIEDNGDVWLVGQWRRPTKSWSWEIPEGGVPHHEDLEVGAKRELREETGLQADHLLRVLDFDISNSVSDEVGTSFIAYGLTQGLCAPEGTEVIEVRRVHFTVLMAEIEAGLIRDSLTLATALRAHQLAVAGRLPAQLCQAMLTAHKGD
ncbi:MAG: hypothetical protein RL186_1185 [Pseudomonadota bacterium]|jgi:8-oxo-dGTP pyrophosphatase MutT (NUDIX family)